MLANYLLCELYDAYATDVRLICKTIYWTPKAILSRQRPLPRKRILPIAHIYIHTYIHACMLAYIQTHTHTHIYIYMYIHIYVHTYICIS